MALSAQLEALLTEIEKVDPAGAKEQRAILEKFPKLQTSVQEGVLRQSDYSRLSDETKRVKTESEDVLKRWNATYPVHQQLQNDYKEAQQRIAKLEKEVQDKATEAAAALAASGEGSGDPKKIAEEVMKSLGSTVPTKAELATLIAEETKKQADVARETFFKQDVPAALLFQSSMNDVQFQWMREHPDKLFPKTEFSKFMTDNRLNDPLEAYQRFTADERKAAELAKAKEEGIAEGRKQAQADFVPGSSGSPSPGHLQLRLNKKDENDPLFNQDIALGDNSLAMAAAAEMRSEGRV